MKKPTLTPSSKEKRLLEAKHELNRENEKVCRMRQTTLMLDEGLLYSIKEIALQRKKNGIEPSSLSGMIRQALMDIVDKEGKV